MATILWTTAQYSDRPVELSATQLVITTEVISLLVDVFKDVSSCGPTGELLRMSSTPWVVEQDDAVRYCTETKMFV